MSAPTPVSPWTAILAVADKCREYGHETILNGENINAAEEARRPCWPRSASPRPSRTTAGGETQW